MLHACVHMSTVTIVKNEKKTTYKELRSRDGAAVFDGMGDALALDLGLADGLVLIAAHALVLGEALLTPCNQSTTIFSKGRIPLLCRHTFGLYF